MGQFGFGQSPFPIPAFVAQALRESAHENDYVQSAGLPELRAAVSSFLARKMGVAYKPDAIFVGPGSKAVMYMLQAVYPADLLLPRPSWVSYAPQARLLGRNVVWLDTVESNDWKLEAATLRELCEQAPSTRRLLVLNSPQNPSGHMYDADELREIAAVAREFNVIVLSDEIYAQLSYAPGTAHESMAKLYPEGTVVVGGMSKSFGAGGWRLGFMGLPDQLQHLFAPLETLASATFSCVAAPVQHAAAVAFAQSDELDAYISKCNRIIQAISDRVCDKLRAAGVLVPNARGAFYLFPNFDKVRAAVERKHGVTTGAALCELIVEKTHVALLPGQAFGLPESSLTARMCLVDFDGAEALKCVQGVPDGESVAEALAGVCEHLYAGIDALCAWLRELEEEE